MKVKVIGKTNLSGTSKKTGKDYNINMVYVTHKANGVEGESCEISIHALRMERDHMPNQSFFGFF